jgi:RimJ/RimL family protein N-acetyltransferase
MNQSGQPLGQPAAPLVLPGSISTRRLRLPVITPQSAAAMLAGRRDPAWHRDFPRRDDLDAVSMVKVEDSWNPRLIVRAFDGLVCGTIGFFGPPQAAADGVPETEAGYGLVAEARGHGLATEALKALLIEVDRLGVRVRAQVLPENTASVRVLAKCGFTELRGTSEDGELVMARPAAGAQVR